MIAKRTIRIPMNAGLAQDVDPQMLPDGAVTALHNYYYDKGLQIRKRRPYMPATEDGLTGRTPADAYQRGSDRVMVERSPTTGSVYRIDANTSRVQESTSLVTASAIRRDPHTPITSGVSHGWSSVTAAAGQIQKHHSTAYERQAYSGNHYVRVYEAGGSIYLDSYRCSATAPDGVPVLTALFLGTGNSGLYQFDVAAHGESPEVFTVALINDATSRIDAYTARFSAPSTALYTDSLSTTGAALVTVGAWSRGVHVCYSPALGADVLVAWRPNTYGGGSSQATATIHSTSYTGSAPAFCGGDGGNVSYVAFTMSSTSTAPTMVQFYALTAGTVSVAEAWGVPCATTVESRPMGITAAGTSVVAVAVAHSGSEGNRRGWLMTGSSLTSLRPAASYGWRVQSTQSFTPSNLAAVTDIYTGCELVWADHEYTPGSTDPVLAHVYSADLGSREALKAQECGGTWYYSGGLVQYDEGEVGFLVPPENISLTAGGSGAAIGADRTVSYRVVYEKVNSQGKREQSAPSIAQTIYISATTNVILKIPPPPTRKTGVIARVYRDVQLGGQIHHSVTYAAFVSGQTSYVTVTDRLSDATAASAEILYSDMGILEQHAPPSEGRTALWEHGGRLWCADGWRARYSTEARRTELVNWADSAYVELPSAVVAFGSLGDTLVILCESGVYLLGGQGPTRDGAQPWGTPYTVAGAHGCSAAYGGQRSVCVCPQGVVYRSTRGLELLQGGGGGAAPVYLGGPVEDELARYPYVVAATHDQALGSVRFLVALTDDDAGYGRVLVWEYETSVAAQRPIWHTETTLTDSSSPGGGTPSGYTMAAGAAGMWGADYVAAMLPGSATATAFRWMVQSDSASATGFSAQVTLGRVRPGEGAGHGRIYRATILGSGTTGSATTTVLLTYDDSATSMVNLTAAGTTGEYVRSIDSARQKCHHVVMTITEDQRLRTHTVGTKWNAVTIEAGKLPGTRRLPAAGRY